MAKTISREWNTNAIKTLIYNGAKKGTERCAEHLLEEARVRVPYLNGKLVTSGHVEETPSGFMVRFTADSLSDSGFDYAIIQHEEESFQHAEGRTDHYLRNPLEQHKDMYRRWIAESAGEKL